MHFLRLKMRVTLTHQLCLAPRLYACAVCLGLTVAALCFATDYLPEFEDRDLNGDTTNPLQITTWVLPYREVAATKTLWIIAISGTTGRLGIPAR